MRTSVGKLSWPMIRQRFIFPALIVLVLDQLTKYWAATSPPIPLSTFLSLRLSFNPGAAFSSFTAYAALLTFVGIAAVIGIPFLLHSMRGSGFVPLGLIWGGAIGNLMDRLLFGAVRDFIAFSFWPSFNIADSAITIGVAMLLWQEWRTHG